MKILAWLALPIILMTQPARADSNAQQWLTISTDVKIAKSDSINGMVLFRSKPDSWDLGQFVLRAGITHNLPHSRSVSLAYSFVDSPILDAADVQQHRLSETISSPLKDFAGGTFDGRLQAEQILSRGSGDIGVRARPRLRWLRPLNEDQSVELQLSDELLFALNNTEWGQKSGFQANRASAALEIDINKHFAVVPGYTWQHVWRSNRPDRNDHVSALTLKTRF